MGMRALGRLATSETSLSTCVLTVSDPAGVSAARIHWAVAGVNEKPSIRTKMERWFIVHGFLNRFSCTEMPAR